jgi:hypothetical protein
MHILGGDFITGRNYRGALHFHFSDQDRRVLEPSPSLDTKKSRRYVCISHGIVLHADAQKIGGVVSCDSSRDPDPPTVRQSMLKIYKKCVFKVALR